MVDRLCILLGLLVFIILLGNDGLLWRNMFVVCEIIGSYMFILVF